MANEKTTVLAWPDTRDIEADTPAIIRLADDFEVVVAADYERGGGYLVDIKTGRAKIEARLKGVIASAFQTHRGLTAMRNELDQPWKTAYESINMKMLIWRQRQERIRREREAVARAAAEKAEEERRLREAEMLEAAGHNAAADAVLNAPAPPTAVVLPDPVPKVAGVTARQTPWRWEIANDAKIPRLYLMPDKQKIDGMVRALKKQAETEIPGIRVFREEVLTVRTER